MIGICRQSVSKNPRNAQKRHFRLRKRARQLSDAKMVVDLQMRETNTPPHSAQGDISAASNAAGSPAPLPAYAGCE